MLLSFGIKKFDVKITFCLALGVRYTLNLEKNVPGVILGGLKHQNSLKASRLLIFAGDAEMVNSVLPHRQQ